MWSDLQGRQNLSWNPRHKTEDLTDLEILKQNQWEKNTANTPFIPKNLNIIYIRFFKRIKSLSKIILDVINSFKTI